MADEIKLSVSLGVTNGTLVSPSNVYSKTFDQAAPIAPAPGGVNIGTSEETINFGDITPGWVEIVNLDDTNFVDLGFSTGVYGITLPVNGVCLFKMKSGATLYAKADTAACEISIRGIND